MSSLQQKFQKKLQGGKFRWLNEALYTQSSADSFSMMAEEPQLFDVVFFLLLPFQILKKTNSTILDSRSK
jgi:hypothetical protein